MNNLRLDVGSGPVPFPELVMTPTFKKAVALLQPLPQAGNGGLPDQATNARCAASLSYLRGLCPVSTF